MNVLILIMLISVVFFTLKMNKIMEIDVKGYLRYKTILCHKVALDVQLMNFFI